MEGAPLAPLLGTPKAAYSNVPKRLGLEGLELGTACVLSHGQCPTLTSKGLYDLTFTADLDVIPEAQQAREGSNDACPLAAALILDLRA